MRRTFAVLGWILLGALAAGSSLGYYLYLANTDREWLSLRVSALQEQQQQAEQEKEKLSDQLNRKSDTVKLEEARLGSLLQACEERTSRLVQAVPLAKPDGRALRDWKNALSVALGVSLKLPPGVQTQERDRDWEALTVNRGASSTWLAITPYDMLREQELAQDLVETEAVSYTVNGTLLSGIRGRDPNSRATTYLLRAGADRTPTHLVWAQTNDRVNATQVLDTLATLAFKTND